MCDFPAKIRMNKLIHWLEILFSRSRWYTCVRCCGTIFSGSWSTKEADKPCGAAAQQRSLATVLGSHSCQSSSHVVCIISPNICVAGVLTGHLGTWWRYDGCRQAIRCSCVYLKNVIFKNQVSRTSCLCNGNLVTHCPHILFTVAMWSPAVQTWFFTKVDWFPTAATTQFLQGEISRPLLKHIFYAALPW